MSKEMLNMLEKIYSCLDEHEFFGSFIGEESLESTLNKRWTIEPDAGDPIQDIFAQIKADINSLESEYGVCIWKGWTDSDDSYLGYKWNVRIWASTDPASHGKFYVIRGVRPYKMAETSKWDYGVDISVY